MLFMGRLMSLPEQDWRYLSELTVMAIANEDPDYRSGSPSATLLRAHHELFEYFSEEVARRRRRPWRDDLIGLLMALEPNGERLSDDAVIYNCYSLILGANVTTPHVVSSVIEALCTFPGTYRSWSGDPAMLKIGMEEALRWASPASHFMRYARRDVVIRGQLIRKGEAVTAWLGSANRDEEVFENAS
jgi:cytochrome P450